MKNLIYAGTSTQASVPVGQIVPLTQTVRKFNRCGSKSEVERVGSAISIESECGCRPRYNAWVSVTFAGATAGNAIVSLYQDGVAIPFANATATITTPTTQYVTVNIPASILVPCCNNTSLTIVNTGAIGLTVINASILVVED